MHGRLFVMVSAIAKSIIGAASLSVNPDDLRAFFTVDASDEAAGKINKTLVVEHRGAHYTEELARVTFLATMCRELNVALVPLKTESEEEWYTKAWQRCLDFAPTTTRRFWTNTSKVRHECHFCSCVGDHARFGVVIPVSRAAMLIDAMSNCLPSVAMQRNEVDCQVDIVVSYVHNGEKENLAALVQLCMQYDAAIIFHRHQHECFPPALARNVGARRVHYGTTVFLDADIVLHPHTIAKALKHLKGGNAIVLVQAAMMAAGPSLKSVFQFKDAKTFEETAAKRPLAPGTGACVFVPQDILQRTHGYDERFIGYGATDWDFTARIEAAGIPIVDLTKNENVRVMHQWHGCRVKTNPPNPENRKLYARMKGKQLLRNPEMWGGVAVEEKE